MYTINWSNKAEQYKPVFEEVAEQLKDVPNLIFASYDITDNDPITHQIKEFPELVFACDQTKRDKSINFEEDISADNLLDFLKENSPAYKEYLEKNKKEL